MRPEDIREFTRKQPFAPYRIHVSGGSTYDIRYPDQVIVLRSSVVIAVDGENDICDHVEHVALIHIVRVEELRSENLIAQNG